MKAGTIDKYKVIPSASGTTATGDPYYVLVSDSLRQEYASKTANLPWVYCKATDGGGSHSMSYADGLSDADKLGFVTATRSIGINSGRYHNYRIKNCTSVTVLNRSNGTKDEKRIWLNVFKYNSLTESFEYQEQIKSAYNSSKDIVVSATLNASDEYVIQITSGSTSNSKAVQIRFIGVAPTSHTVTYKSGDGSGDDVVDDDATVVGGCPSTFSYTGYDFAGWKDGDNNDVEVGDAVTSDMTLTAQWTVHVAKYTVKYMDGTTLLGTEEVNVTEHPAGLAENPKKDCYTFAAWSPALSSVSGEENDEVEVNATWTPVYSSSATLISDAVVSGKPNVNTVLAASNIVSSITFDSKNYEFTSNETKKGYYGYKDKASGDYMKILVKQGKRVQVLFGNLGADPTIKINGANGSLDATRQTGDNVENTFTYTASAADALISITMGSGTNTLKKVDIIQLYTATRVDGKSDGAGSDANVLETTLPTPTAISGWTFTGWTANEDVKAGEDTKTAGTVLAAGTYTLLANTTFTAQWAEASSTYDVTYVSAHGTAPADDNAASVVLAELSEEGWAHKGWTANVDVTVDATTVEAGTLIANGKTAVLESNVTFTAVWKEIFTVTFDAKGGSSVDPVDVEDGATLAAAPADPTKDDYVFQGWSETDGGAVVADITAITISDDKTFYAKWKLDVQVSEIVFSNSFKGWIVGSTVTVFYMAGESAPTITSYAGKNLKAEGGVVISGDKIIATGTDDSEVEFDLVMTEVTPLATTGAQTFNGSEGYVKTRHAWTADRKWKMSKYAEDGRVARGETSMYIFLGAAESVTFDWGKQQKTNDVAVYVNGTFVKNLGKDNNSAVELTKGNNMVAFYSLQTSGDVWLNGLTVAPWVPVTAVTLKEGEDAISSKEIYAGANFTLTAEVTPDNASDKTITWTSSNNDVATVVNGVVTGVAANATPVTITASTVDGVTATCEVTVTTAPEPSADPVITEQPASANYYEGATIAELKVVATGESLTYQWYLGSEAIEGAIAATYQPTVSAIGSYVYHCVVTNTEAGNLPTSLASDNATITIADDPAAIKLFGNTGVLNTTDFISPEATTIEISDVEYPCLVQFSSNRTSLGGATPSDMVMYNVTTDKAMIKMTFYNNNSGVKKAILYKYEEGAEAPEKIEIEVPGQTVYTTDYYTFNSSKNRSFYVCMNDRSNIRVLQVKVIDNGANPVKQFGQVGYSLNLNKGRLYAKDGVEKTFEGWTLTTSSEYKVYNNSNLATKAANSFTIASPAIMHVERSGGKYYVYQDPEDKGTLYAANADIELNATGTWYLSSETTSSAASFTKIEFKAPFAATPAFGTMNDVELCAGDPYTAIDGAATVSDGGTVTYKWYAEGDAENVLATTATYTPAADGNYYVVATNSLADHQDKSATSDVVKVEHFASAQITTAPADVLKHSGLDVTLNVVAEGKNVSYEWFTCDDELGANPVAFDPAQTGTSLLLENIEAGVKYYKVLVSSDCGTASAVAKVEGFDDLPLLDVDGNMKWDFSKANDGTTASSNMCENAVLVNVTGIKNDANFKSQYIMATANKFSGDKLQASMIKFHTTVPGAVIVKFANTGNKSDYRYLVVNGVQTEAKSKDGTMVTYAEYVPAGDVVLTVTTANEGNMFNFTSVEFKLDNDLEPARTDDWLAPGELGTICIPQGAVAVGADIYELVGKEPQYGKIVFESVEHMKPGKPYLFQAKGNRIDFILTDEALASEPDNSGAMKGTFAEITLTGDQLENVYYFADHALWSCVDLTATGLLVPANRAYVKMDQVQELSNPNPAPGRRRVVLGVHGEQVVTGVENLNASEQPIKLLINGQIFIIRGEKMYDATGKLVK